MKKFAEYYLFLLIFLPFLLCVAGCGGSGDSLESYLQKSFTAAEQADWKDALKYAEKALQKDSLNCNALILSALALENTDKPEQALVQAAKAASER